MKSKVSFYFNNQNSQYRNQNCHLKNRKAVRGIKEKIFGNQKIIQEIKRYNFEYQNNTQEIKYPIKINEMGISFKTR